MKLFLFKVDKVYEYYVVAKSYEDAMRTWFAGSERREPTSVELINCQGLLVQGVDDDKP